MTTQVHVDRKLHDLERMNVILVPKMCFKIHNEAHSWDYFLSDMQFLGGQLMLPLSFSPRNPRFLPTEIVLSEITRQYTAIGEFRDNVILSRKQPVWMDGMKLQ